MVEQMFGVGSLPTQLQICKIFSIMYMISDSLCCVCDCVCMCIEVPLHVQIDPNPAFTILAQSPLDSVSMEIVCTALMFSVAYCLPAWLGALYLIKVSTVKSFSPTLILYLQYLLEE